MPSVIDSAISGTLTVLSAKKPSEVVDTVSYNNANRRNVDVPVIFRLEYKLESGCYRPFELKILDYVVDFDLP